MIERVAEREPIIKLDHKINTINTRIEFMNNSNISPRCKQLNTSATADQLLAANDDVHIIDLACQTLHENVPDKHLQKEWEKHMEAQCKSQDKTKLMEQMAIRYAHLLSEHKPPKEDNRDPETSSEASFVSSISTLINAESERSHKHIYNPSDLTKEIIDNVPVFDGKMSELNQFINTIESVTSLYSIPEIQIVLLCTRGKPHKIITHIIDDDPKAVWEGVKRKLTSNYGATKSRIDAGIQLKNINRNKNETVGE